MLPRFTTLLVLAVAVVVSGCSDQASRATAPQEAPSLALGTPSVNQIRAMINAVTPAPHRGSVQGAFGKLNGALGSGGTGDAEAQAFQTVLLNLYDAGSLVAPAGGTLDVALVNLMNAVFTFAGLTQYVVQAPANPNAEFGLEIVTASDFDGNGNAQVKTNAGRAAMIVNQGTFGGPAIVAVVQKASLNSSYVFPLPPGIKRIAEVFEMSSSSDIQPQGIVVSICDDETVASPAQKWVLHDIGLQFAVKVAPNATGHLCPSDHASNTLGPDAPMWARGLDAAGSFISAVFGPKPLYAGHSLAHAIIVDELSPFTVGEDEDVYTVRVVGSEPQATHSDGHVDFEQRVELAFWVEIKKNGVVQQCELDLDLTDVVGQVTATSVNPAESGASDDARSCAQQFGTYAWRFELLNPRASEASSGVIDFTVNGEAATPQLTYTASIPVVILY